MGKSVTVKAAWIKFAALIIVAVVTGLFSLKACHTPIKERYNEPTVGDINQSPKVQGDVYGNVTTTVIVGKQEANDTKDSEKRGVLQELQYARDYLGYVIAAGGSSWRLFPPGATLLYQDRIRTIFADNIELTDKIQLLYESLRTGLKYADQIQGVHPLNQLSRSDIEAMKDAIKNIIKHADTIGPSVAIFVGEKWEVPDPNFNIQQLNTYYSRRMPHEASGPVVEVRTE